MINYLNIKLHTPLWLSLLLIGVIVLSLPSLFEPYHHAEEATYLVAGEMIKKDVLPFTSVLGSLSPPLLLIAILSDNLAALKSVYLVWSVVTVFVFWKFTEVLFAKEESSQIFASFVFASLITIPLYEGTIASTSGFALAPMFAGLFLIGNKLSTKNTAVAIILLLLAALFEPRTLLVLPAVIFLFIPKKLGRPLSGLLLLASAWLILSLSAIVNSEVSRTTDLLLLAAPVSILLTIFLFSKTSGWVYAVIPLTLAFLILLKFDFRITDPYKYFRNFVNFAVGKTDVDTYFSSFGDDVVRDYKVAEYLSANTYSDDTIYLTSHRPQVYALTRRLSVQVFFNETVQHTHHLYHDGVSDLASMKPKFIIIYPNRVPTNQIYSFLIKNYSYVEEVEGVSVWRSFRE